MKKITTSSLLAILMITVFSFTFPKNEVSNDIVFFKGTWKEALKLAKNENKLIFLDISASWCGPCKKLKRTTFTNKKVAEYFNAKYINVELDGEYGEGVALAQKFHLTGYPTLYFIDARENIVSESIGFVNHKEILKWAKSTDKK
ncbi:MAG: thioredoxin family protein [Ferruginibacter sp.]|nr:thioredoxin family protein [Ferruginibacter sp.]